jgi:hypothetical protein
MRAEPNKFSLSPINRETVLIKGIRILRLVADHKPRHQVFLFPFYLFQIHPSELGIHALLRLDGYDLFAHVCCVPLELLCLLSGQVFEQKVRDNFFLFCHVKAFFGDGVWDGFGAQSAGDGFADNQRLIVAAVAGTWDWGEKSSWVGDDLW